MCLHGFINGFDRWRSTWRSCDPSAQNRAAELLPLLSKKFHVIFIMPTVHKETLIKLKNGGDNLSHLKTMSRRVPASFSDRLKTYDDIKHVWFDCNAKTRKRLTWDSPDWVWWPPNKDFKDFILTLGALKSLEKLSSVWPASGTWQDCQFRGIAVTKLSRCRRGQFQMTSPLEKVLFFSVVAKQSGGKVWTVTIGPWVPIIPFCTPLAHTDPGTERKRRMRGRTEWQSSLNCRRSSEC